MELSPAYLSTIASQVGGLSAFLGGFAATFLGTLLALTREGRLATSAIATSAISSVAFIVAVVGSTTLVAAMHPEAPVGPASIGGAQATMTLAFVLGLYALLVALGISGWLRSRPTGWITSIAAGLGFILVTSLLVGVG